MKKSIFLLLLAVATYTVQAQDVRIFGTIKKTKLKEVNLEFYNSPLDKEVQRIPLPLNDKGQFFEALTITRPIDAVLVVGKERMPVYLETNLSIEISGPGKAFAKKAIISDSTFCNNYLRDFDKAFSQARLEKERISHLKSDDFISYGLYVDSISTVQVRFLENYPQAKKLTKTFVRRQRASYRYAAANYKAKYVNDKNFYWKEVVTIDIGNYGFMNDLSVAEQDIISVPAYYEFLEHYFTYRFNEASFKPVTEYDLIGFEYRLASTLFQDRVKNIFLTKKYGEILQTYPFEISRAFYDKFSSDVQVVDYRRYIEGIIEQVNKVSPGSAAPKVEFMDSEGKVINFESFKGKVVFVNFWATWCKPCMESLPAYNEFMAKYEGQPIVFLNVAVEEDEKPWRAAFRKFSGAVVHTRVDKLADELPAAFQVKQLPAYIVIDKQGRIVTTLAPKPGSDQLEQIIGLSLK